jgi:peptidyl-tRNA hydrolase
MPKPQLQYTHTDRLGTPIAVDNIVAFCYSGGNTIHVGRVVKLTARRVRIAYTYEYTNHSGERVKWTSTYQGHPERLIVLNNIEQQLTVMALKGLI